MRHTAVCAAVVVGATLGVGLAVPAAPAARDDWAQFMGPGARGVVEGRSLPETWSTTENVAWVADIPGLGWSSPIVSGDSVFLGVNALDEFTMATPAIAQGSLFIRTASKLYRIRDGG